MCVCVGRQKGKTTNRQKWWSFISTKEIFSFFYRLIYRRIKEQFFYFCFFYWVCKRYIQLYKQHTWLWSSFFIIRIFSLALLFLLLLFATIRLVGMDVERMEKWGSIFIDVLQFALCTSLKSVWIIIIICRSHHRDTVCER